MEALRSLKFNPLAPDQITVEDKIEIDKDACEKNILKKLPGETDCDVYELIEPLKQCIDCKAYVPMSSGYYCVVKR